MAEETDRQLRARFHFRVRRLLVAPDLVGTSHEIGQPDARVIVTFPTGEAPESEASSAPMPPFPEDDPPPAVVGGMLTSSTQFARSGDVVYVDVLRVDVFVPANGVTAAVFRDDDLMDWTGPQREASALLWSTKALAEAALERVLEWVRTEGNQHWLGAAGARPEPVGRAELVDMAEWTRFPVNVNLETMVMRRVLPEQVLAPGRLEQILEWTAQGEGPSLAHSVLSDAAFYANDAEPPDPTRAVLTAAIAVELKVKQTLRDGAEGQVRELVELLFEKPRDYSVAAVALFDEPLRVVRGTSLRTTDKKLYNAVDNLFRRRNAIAHRGEVISQEEANELVASAFAAFRALRALEIAESQ